MQSRRRFIGKIVRGSVWIGCGMVCFILSPSHADNAVLSASLTCSESFRHEFFKRSLGNGSETQSASGGKLSISAELPCTSQDTSAFAANTPVIITVGSFTFRSTLGTAPTYQSGKTSVRLLQTFSNNSGNTRTITATVQVRWSRDKVSVKVDAKLPQAGKPIAAQDFVTSPVGNVEGEANASLHVGDVSAELNVEMQGRVQRRTASDGFDYGEAVTVNLRGKSAALRDKTEPRRDKPAAPPQPQINQQS